LNDVNNAGEDKNNMYVFEGEDYKQKGKPEEVKMPQYIEIKRQKTVKPGIYDIDKYYQKALNSGTVVKEKKKHKGWRALANGGYDHQFFNVEELNRLQDKEDTYALDNKNQTVCLTEAEIKKKDKLLKEGFSNWGKKEFFHFINLCERYGRTAYERIANEMANKT
jgi:SWI/SNF-related matrix-associated actin-dependent regulator of chromatin subfamily A member 5